jgi:hypothetical protein
MKHDNDPSRLRACFADVPRQNTTYDPGPLLHSHFDAATCCSLLIKRHGIEYETIIAQSAEWEYACHRLQMVLWINELWDCAFGCWFSLANLYTRDSGLRTSASSFNVGGSAHESGPWSFPSGPAPGFDRP